MKHAVTAAVVALVFSVVATPAWAQGDAGGAPVIDLRFGADFNANAESSRVVGGGAESVAVEWPDGQRKPEDWDGRGLRLDDAAVMVGQGENGEANLTGNAMTILVRLRNEGEGWDITPLSKHGGHGVLQYNLFAFGTADGGAEFGTEIGTDDGMAKASAFVDADEGRAWITLIGRYDGAHAELFVNGRLAGRAGLTGALRAEGPAPLVIGGEPAGGGIGRRLTGVLDRATVWDRALSLDEIAALSGVEAIATPGTARRPVYHFTAPKNWINDPNGMVYHEGEYHLFYQYNPFGDNWGHMSWGHAVSTDLVRWTHLPVAIPERNGVMAFSGSAVIDRNNLSGFGAEGAAPMVAVYTGRQGDPERQDQRIAYSTDNGRTFTDYENNPVIDLGMENFRDPKVFWHDETDRWIMVVALATQHTVQFYASDDLKRWEHLSDFGPAGATGVPNWECPELFELPVEGLPGEKRWVLQIDVGNGAPAGGSGSQYFIGHFDGKRFVNENPADTTLWVDHGADFYAAQAFNGLPNATEGGRVVWLAWMNNWNYAGSIPAGEWRGAMTLPREVSLVKTPEGIRLRQSPVRELESLRTGSVAMKSPDAGSRVSMPGTGTAYEIDASFRATGAGRFGLVLREGETERSVLSYDPGTGELAFDRRASGQTGFGPGFGAVHRVRVDCPEGELTLRVFVDETSVEVFANDGAVVMTERIFPDPSSDGLSVFREGNAGELLTGRVYPIGR